MIRNSDSPGLNLRFFVFFLMGGALPSDLYAQAPYLDYVGAGHAVDITVTTSSVDETSTGVKTINAAGLSGMQHDAEPENAWLSLTPSANPVVARGNSHWIRYDLGHSYQLGKSTIWNFNEEEFTGPGIKSVTIDTSMDGVVWADLGTFELARALGSGAYQGAAGPDFSGTRARYIVMTANSVWGDTTEAGFSEMRIDVNASPVVIGAPSLQMLQVQSGSFQLMARTASDASLSQLEHSNDLVKWYAMQNIAGSSVSQPISIPRNRIKNFFRLGTRNNAGAIPVVSGKSLTVTRGQTVVLGNGNLNAVDSDTSSVGLLYSVSSVRFGRFELLSNSGVAITTFSQADVSMGRVQFVHDGSVNPPSFDLSLSDGSSIIAPQSAEVTFHQIPPANTVPVLAQNRLIIGQGQTVVLSPSDLMATDSEESSSQLIFTISALNAGRFERVSATGVGISEFTQAEVNARTIQFVHDSSTVAPEYLVSVSDGLAMTLPNASSISFTPEGTGNAPDLVANSQATFMGSSTVLGQAQLDAVDLDTPPSGLTYQVSNVAGGQFERVAQSGVPVTSFTQADINSHLIRFVQNGSATRPAYSVNVSDGSHTSSTSAASISFCDGSRTSMMTPGEMESLNKLVELSQVTHTVIASGRWTDTSVWQGGVLPAAGARIHIPSGLAVVVDSQLTPEFKSLRIDGMLRFSPHVNTRLKCDTIVSYHCARFEVGTAEIPISGDVIAEIIFADDGPIDTSVDFAQLGRGAILHGESIVYGAARTNKVAFSVHPRAGDLTLQLKSVPTGWEVGDELIITGTIVGDPRSDEIRSIAAINGTSITLNQALSLDHTAPRTDLNVYVANATRNIIFSSENATIARRGHIMIMHTLEADINYARFYQLGRTDKTRNLDDTIFDFDGEAVGNETSAGVVFTTTPGARTNIRGRYVIHLHRGGTDPTTTPAVINGCVAYDGPGWGIVSHSANARFLNNVTYAIQGTGYYTEAGDEIGEMVGNIAIRSFNPAFMVDSEGGAIDPDLGSPQQEFGNDGDGYWLSGNLVSVRNNVSAGSTAHGIIYWTDGLVEADVPRGRANVKVSEIPNGHLIPGRETIPVWWAPLAECSGNECYGSTIGFRARYIHAQTYVGEGGSPFHARPPHAYVETLHPTIENLTVWANRDGVLLNYNERLILRNALIVGTGAPFFFDAGTANAGAGLDQGTEVTNGPSRIENVVIEGFSTGLVAPRSDQWVYDNLTLKNTTDIFITEPRLAPRTLTMDNVTFGSLDGTAVAGRSGRRNVAMQIDLADTSFQPFYFVLPDRITLNGEGVYFNSQSADFTPLPVAPVVDDVIAPIPNSYINKTNQQLQTAFGLSFGGVVPPVDSRVDVRVHGGVVGSAAPIPTVFPPLFDMTSEGLKPEPMTGGPTPQLLGNYLRIRKGQSLVLTRANLHTIDTDTEITGLTYTVANVANGHFAHRNALNSPITSFTQAQINGGVIRFVHDNSLNSPAFTVNVSDGSTTTGSQSGNVVFSMN